MFYLQVLSDLTKWESAGNANELAAVFQSHMGSAVKPSGMLVNIGRIDGSADSAAAPETRPTQCSDCYKTIIHVKKL